MDPKSFGKLPRDPNGLPVVKLMTDPSMGEDGEEGYLSLVDKGANLRTVRVAKAETDAPWWQRLFNPTTWFRVAKGDDAGAPDFDAAIAAQDLRSGMWTATDTLVNVVHQIMADDEITDKAAAVKTSLGQFNARVVELVDGVTTAMKADDATALRDAMRVHWPAHQNPDAVRAPHFRDTVDTDPYSEVARKSAAQPSEDTAMTPEQLQAIALGAASTAMQVAKQANPMIGDTDLRAIGHAAMMDVYKAAVGGPAQPQLPTNHVQQQLAQLGSVNGAPSDASGLFGRAVRGLGKLVRKSLTDDSTTEVNLDEPGTLAKVLGELVAKIDKIELAIEGHGEGDARKFGVNDVVQKHHDWLSRIDTQVRTLAGAPARPPASVPEGSQPAGPATTVRKGVGDGGDPYAGSALDYSDLINPPQAAAATGGELQGIE